MSPTDAVLIKKIQHGDGEAFAMLVERYQHRTYNVALKMLDNPEDARDAVQEIFVRVYRSLPDFKGKARFSTWLYRITVNYCLDASRARQKDRGRNVSLETGGYLSETLAATESGPEELAENRDIQNRVRRAVAGLPSHYRAALVLHYYEGLSYREVAGVLQLSPNTVAAHIARAKKRLQKQLQGGEGDALHAGKAKAGRVLGGRTPVT